MKKLVAVVAMVLMAVSTAGVGEAADDPVTYVERTVKVKPGAARVATRVACPEGTSVVGGGVRGPDYNALEIVGSAPFDGKDGDRDPDDGWRGVAHNRFNDPSELTVHAICTSDVTYTYVTTVVVADKGSRTSAFAMCPSGMVAGGGAVLTRADRASQLTATIPTDSLDDMDILPDDGWGGAAWSEKGKSKLRVTAICDPTNVFYDYRLNNMGSLPQSSFISEAPTTCADPGELHVSGGAAFDGSEDGPFFGRLFPSGTPMGTSYSASPGNMGSTVNAIGMGVCRDA